MSGILFVLCLFIFDRSIDRRRYVHRRYIYVRDPIRIFLFVGLERRNSGAIMYSTDVYREEKTWANKMIFEA